MWPIKLRQIINFKTRSNFADAKMWKEGNSLAVQGWGLSAYTAVTQVQFLVKELRSCQPWGAAFKKKSEKKMCIIDEIWFYRWTQIQISMLTIPVSQIVCFSRTELYLLAKL